MKKRHLGIVIGVLLMLSASALIFVMMKTSNGEIGADLTTSDQQVIRKHNIDVRKEAARRREARRRAELQALIESRMSVEEVEAALKKSCSAETKIGLLSDLSDNHSDRVLALLNSMLDDESPEVRAEVLSLMADFNSDAILPSLEKALNDEDANVRVAAVEAIGDLNAPELLAKAVDDKSEDVRDAAFDIAGNADDQDKLDIYQYGMYSSYGDVRSRSVDIISSVPSKRSVDMLIEGLKISDKELHEDIGAALEYLVGREFQSYSDAVNWWKENKDSYSSDLN